MNRALTVHERLEAAEAEAAYWREKYEELSGARLAEPIEGLTLQQSRLVHALRAASGRTVPYEALFDVLGSQSTHGTGAAYLRVVRCHIGHRRPDIAERIETVWAVGCRWRRAPETPGEEKAR